MGAIHPVILCGGGGTRLWPRSRRDHPKPFLPLLGKRTLFQDTLDRVGDPLVFAEPIIVAGEAHLAHILAQAGDGAAIIVEPAAKNTAPAIALAAQTLPEDAVMLVCPSDHHIADNAAFGAGVEQAASLARESWLVSFGIRPNAPETGYGYIRLGEPLAIGHRIATFVEKPDLARAQSFLADGGYVWNGGLFAFTAGTFLDELRKHRTKMAQAVAAAMNAAARDGSSIRPHAEAFASIEGESVDYAVMENTDRAAVIATEMGWSDIGNWEALHLARPRDADGNCLRGPGELLDCRNVMVETDGPSVSVVGLENVVVVVNGDDILVTSHMGAQGVGRLRGASEQ